MQGWEGGYSLLRRHYEGGGNFASEGQCRPISQYTRQARVCDMQWAGLLRCHVLRQQRTCGRSGGGRARETALRRVAGTVQTCTLGGSPSDFQIYNHDRATSKWSRGSVRSEPFLPSELNGYLTPDIAYRLKSAVAGIDKYNGIVIDYDARGYGNG